MTGEYIDARKYYFLDSLYICLIANYISNEF